MQQIDESALNRIVKGRNLVPGSLRDQLSASETLVVFLRHFG